ncbi:MAG: hypothetical protein M3O41_02700 [Pseudomonadota bacterium]|nr:hypothetical protein [Pseudomonadota bacterium]
MDPGNGAAWFDSFWRAGRRNDVAAMRQDLSAIATSRSFDTYWNATISHITNAIVKTHTMDLPTALVATIGVASATDVPPYQAILNACKGESLKDPDRLNICRQVSTVMRGGDTYITEMIGIAIAKRAWPEGSPAYVDAVSARRVGHYRMDADAKPSLRRFLFSGFAAKRLQLMMEKTSEQEVILAEIWNAGWSPEPPSDYSDGSSGS